MDKDFIWEAEYGRRKHLKPVLKDLLGKQNADSLQCLALYVNNNPYNLEYFVVVSYDMDGENDIKYMKQRFEEAGLFYRQDLSMEELMFQMGNRRFNSMTMLDENTVDIAYNTLFEYKEIEELEKKGYIMSPFGKEKEIFISHSSKDKDEVEKLLPFINAMGLPIWFDKYNIDIGQSIVEKVQEGVEISYAVLFWITDNFLESRWCKVEMNEFIRRMIEEIVVVISILDKSVSADKLPTFLKDIKYVQRDNESFEDIAKKISPTLKKLLR